MKYVEDTEKCCGACKYNGYDKDEGEWSCNNPEAEVYGLLTAYGDGCDEWEDRP